MNNLFGTDSWREARKTYRISKNSPIFFSSEAKCGHAFSGIRPDQIPFEVFVSARVRPRRSSLGSGTHFPQPDCALSHDHREAPLNPFAIAPLTVANGVYPRLCSSSHAT